MLKKVNQIVLFIEAKVFPNIAVLFFLVSVVWMMFEALSRQVFSKSYAISEELITFCILWSILLTLAQAGKKGYHINIDILLNFLPKPVVRILYIVTMVFGLVFSIAILYSAIKYLPHLIQSDVRSASPMRLPMWIVYLAIPISGLLLTLYYVREIVSTLVNKESQNTQSSGQDQNDQNKIDQVL